MAVALSVQFLRPLRKLASFARTAMTRNTVSEEDSSPTYYV